MSLANTILIALFVAFCYATVLFIVSIFLRRNDVADVGWGLGIFLLSAVGTFFQPVVNWVSLLFLTLVLVWGVRLTVRVYARNKNKTEDARYAAWRDEWGGSFYFRSYVQVFLLQGALMVFVGYPLLHLAVFGGTIYTVIPIVFGAVVWVFGFLFEMISDHQLDTFATNEANRGKLLRTGLWQYSRHPNYFGEVTQWWGIWIATLATPWGVFAVVGPLTITYLILKVSGVPMLEKRIRAHPDFAEYARVTSEFFPKRPRASLTSTPQKMMQQEDTTTTRVTSTTTLPESTED